MYIRPESGSKMPRLWRATEKLLASGRRFNATIESGKCTSLKGLDAPEQISKGWRVGRGMLRATLIAPLVSLIIREIYRKVYGVDKATKSVDAKFEEGREDVVQLLKKKFPDMPSGSYLIRKFDDSNDMSSALEEIRKCKERKETVFLVAVIQENHSVPDFTAPWMEGVIVEPIVIREKVTRGVTGDYSELKVEKARFNPVPKLPLRIPTFTGGNYNGHQAGCLDFVVSNPTQEWSMVGDGTSHGSPERRVNLQNGWNEVNRLVSERYPTIVKKAKSKEELSKKLQDLFKEAAEQFSTSSLEDSSTWSFAAVLEFQGEKLLVLCQTGDSPVFHVRKNGEEINRYEGKNVDFTSAEVPSPKLIPVSEGDVILGLTDGFEKRDANAIHNETSQRKYESDLTLNKKILELVRRGKNPEEILQTLSAEIPTVADEDAATSLADDQGGFGFVVR